MGLSSHTRAFLSGVLLANSTPHLASAVAGRRHMTPFGRASSPLVNALWAAANLAGACVLLRRDAPQLGQPASWDARLVALEAGAAAFSLWMAGSEYVLEVNTRAGTR